MMAVCWEASRMSWVSRRHILRDERDFVLVLLLFHCGEGLAHPAPSLLIGLVRFRHEESWFVGAEVRISP